ncbi:MAG: hypothetical protein EAS48_10955 [Chryseobacterium sp.]|nr:MAG: hypothetical protein EAS48_10955 [Chryseobacterium sp.]
MELELRRRYFNGGTNGIIALDGVPLCRSIELPWKMNRRRISCVPEGRYRLQLRQSSRYGQHLELKEVPGRDMILIHSFNHALKESLGCIAPVEKLTGEGKGYGSRAALDKLLAQIAGAKKPVYINIKKENDERIEKKIAGAHAYIF